MATVTPFPVWECMYVGMNACMYECMYMCMQAITKDGHTYCFACMSMHVFMYLCMYVCHHRG